MGNINRKFRLAIGVLACLFIGGCGKPKSTNELINMAKRDHGDCQVVSKQQGSDETIVVLKDELQGFEYEVSSKMYEFAVDGSSFGKVPNLSDNFEQALEKFVLSEAEEDLEDICEKYDAFYEPMVDKVLIRITVPVDVSDKDAKKICEECAEVLQEYNEDERLDGYLVYVAHDAQWFKDNYGTYDPNGNNAYSDYTYSSAGMASECHIGSVKLPDCSFRDEEDEKDDHFLESAKRKNKKAVFVRKEEKTFADTGLPLSRVSKSYAFPGPEDKKDPVVFRYYSVDGKEFFLCDFLDAQTGSYYTNYND